MKTQGKVFVVTGGGNGMGRELVLQLLKKGARVAAVDINKTTLDETADLAGENRGQLSNHVVDITDQAAVSALPDAVIKAHGAVDAIINNAGIIQRFVRIKDLDVKEMERVFNVNFWGTVLMVKAFLPHLLNRPEAHIVNISSMGSYLPVPGQTAYGASKSAVNAFTNGLHSELLDTNVHVTTVYPGAIGTNISANSGVAMEAGHAQAGESRIKMTSAPEAARQIINGIESNGYHVLVGSDARFMYYLARVSPKLAAKFIYSQMRELLPD
ncbi:MAG: SDR family NAD(P)-dependent oxidoreductase [Leptolinea sp.]|nr:SDR family NAD(P)-dependent oxidoreductase [Leptolinea sp.]